MKKTTQMTLIVSLQNKIFRETSGLFDEIKKLVFIEFLEIRHELSLAGSPSRLATVNLLIFLKIESVSLKFIKKKGLKH
jgi:hypothetical protein